MSGSLSNTVLDFDGPTGAASDEFVRAGSGASRTRIRSIVFRLDGNLYVRRR